MRRSLFFALDFAIAAALQWGGFVSHAASVAMWVLAILIGAGILVTLPPVALQARVLGRRHPVVSTLVACLLGAAVFGIAWQMLMRVRLDDTPAPFAVGVRAALIHDNSAPLSLFMAAYPSMYGETLSPIVYLAHIHIVNLQDIPKTVEGYTVAVSASPDGPWEHLKPIPLASTRLYSLAGATSPRALIIPRGAYRLASGAKRENMTQAALLEPTPKLDALLSKPIEPHETVAGWAAFDLRRSGTGAVRNYFRITVRDTTKVSFSEVVELPRVKAGEEAESDTQAGRIDVVGPMVDVSTFHVRYYSDPYPGPTQRQ